MKCKKNNIQIANTTSISISGPKEEKEVMRDKYKETRELTEKYGGRILRDVELEDGFFLEVLFDTEAELKSFKKEVGVK